MAEELFSGFGDQKILAERAKKDINGNSLELSISGDTVTAIGGKSVGGGGSEPVDAYTKAETNELLAGKQDELPTSSASQFLQTNANNEIIWGALPSSLDEVAIFNYGASIWVSEVSDAYDAGKAVFCRKEKSLLPLQAIGSNVCSFNGVIGSESSISLSSLIVAHVELSGQGSWSYKTMTIPKPSKSDNGKVLTVNNLGAIVWDSTPDISGKANKSEMSVTPGTDADDDKTTIQLKTGTSATVLTKHQDVSSMLGKSEFGGTILDTSGDPITDNTGDAIQDETMVELYDSFETTKFGAERARADASGHDIETTYATKSELNTLLASIESKLAEI